MKDTHTLTRRQQEVLDFIVSFITKKHYSPSIREIAQGLNLSSPATVYAHLNALERKGYITKDGTKSRSMVPVNVSLQDQNVSKSDSQIYANEQNNAAKVVSLPLVGCVACGAPILAEQNIEEYVPVPVAVFGDQNSFLLRVRGDSMIQAGIMDGDVVAVREQNYANNGDIVVALLDDSATVKTFYKEKDYVRLQPQNPAFEPIFTRDLKILGIVTGLYRSF